MRWVSWPCCVQAIVPFDISLIRVKSIAQSFSRCSVRYADHLSAKSALSNQLTTSDCAENSRVTASLTESFHFFVQNLSRWSVGDVCLDRISHILYIYLSLWKHRFADELPPSRGRCGGERETHPKREKGTRVAEHFRFDFNLDPHGGCRWTDGNGGARAGNGEKGTTSTSEYMYVKRKLYVTYPWRSFICGCVCHRVTIYIHTSNSSFYSDT